MPPTISLIIDQLAPLVIENLLTIEAVYPILYGSNSIGLKLLLSQVYPSLFCERVPPEEGSRKDEFLHSQKS